MQPMRESQKMFLQNFMSRGILNSKEVKSLYALVCSKYGEDANELQHFVVSINNKLKQFNLDIKKGIGEEKGTSYYVLVNNANTDITLKATDYASWELEFFKKLISAIVNSEEGYIGSIDATNLADNIKEKIMKKTEAQQLLDRLEIESWILRSPEGLISLSTRSLLELELYIEDVFENVVLKCEMCKKICIKGQKCVVCDTKLHFHCATKCFEKQTEARCPSSRCKSPWPYSVAGAKKMIGESMDFTQTETQTSSSNSTNSTRKRRR